MINKPPSATKPRKTSEQKLRELKSKTGIVTEAQQTGSKWRNPTQRAEERKTIAKMRLLGNTMVQIANHLGRSTHTIQNDVKEIEAEWRESAMVSMDTLKSRELHKLDLWEAEVMEQWERSKNDRQKTVEEVRMLPARVSDDNPEKTLPAMQAVNSRTETEAQCADAKYMQLLLNIQERRSKITGLDAPTKVEAVVAVASIDPTVLSNATLAELMEARRVAAATPIN